MTARSHQAIRAGLRRLIRDKSVGANVLMRAIERLMYVEGLLDENGHTATPKNKPGIRPISEANSKRIRELIAAEDEKKTG